jgi:hypothetical protein
MLQRSFELTPYGNDVFGGPPATAIRMTFTLERGRATGFTGKSCSRSPSGSAPTSSTAGPSSATSRAWRRGPSPRSSGRLGIVASIQTHGSLANWHPHLHLLVTDGGFRPDGTFVPLPLHEVATVTEAFRRAVLKLFVQRALLDGDTAASMLAWPHSGFHVHDGVWVPADEPAFTTRLARYCARHPVALGRLRYAADARTVTYHSDKPSGPTAGAETLDVLEFLARVVSHIPNKGQVLQRYYGWYANRTRGARRRASGPAPAVVVVAERAGPMIRAAIPSLPPPFRRTAVMTSVLAG